MTLDRAMEIHHAALTRIVAGLVAFVGLASEHLPIPIYRAALRILRPAESTLRRLIIIAAREIVVELPPKREMPKRQKIIRKGGGPRASSFPLFDTRKDFTPRRKKEKGTPRVRVLDIDPPMPWYFQIGRQPEKSPAPVAKNPVPDGSAAAQRLFRRLAALIAALENIPAQAKRMALWQARRERMEFAKFRSPLRPGRPPGYRKRPTHDVHRVLDECHILAFGVLHGDTS